jgi:hypothetical protein
MSNVASPLEKTAWGGISLIVLAGLIHLIEAPEHFEEAPYLGFLFFANFVGAIVAAFGIYRGSRSWGWGLGILLAASAFLGYILSRTVGLPRFYEEEFSEPMGVLSLIVEALFVLVYIAMVRMRGTVRTTGATR